MRLACRALLAAALAMAPGGCGASTPAAHPAPCPEPALAAVPPAPLFYVQPSSQPPPRCALAVDWSGHALGATPQLPRCAEACAVPSAPPDGRILIQGGWSWPAGAVVPLNAASTVRSPDSRYQCGFTATFTGGGTLAWKTPLGATHEVSLNLPSPTGRLQVDACDPAHGFALVADQYGLYTRLLAAVRLPDARVLRRWSYPGPGQNDQNGVSVVVSLDGRVAAETPVAGDRATGDPVLRSTENGQVLALNAPGTLALFAVPYGTVLEAVAAPWRTPVGLGVGGRFGGAYPEPQGGRLAVAASDGGVVIVTASGRVVARLSGLGLLAP